MQVTHDSRRCAIASIHRPGRELAQSLHQAVAQPVAGETFAGDADQAELFRQQVARGEVIERRNDQAMGEIAGHAEDDERAGIGPFPCYLTDRHEYSSLRTGFLRRLLVAAETGPHRGQDLLGKGVVLARAEAGVERGRQHFRRHGLVDRGVHGPAAFAGILHEARVIIQRLVLGERGCREVEQPGRDHAAAPPHLGDIGDVHVEAMLRLAAHRYWHS